MGVSAPASSTSGKRGPGLLLALLVFAGVVILFLAWGLATPRVAVAPAPVATGPCLPEDSEYRKRIKSAVAEFIDAIKVAEASPRITLAGRVERLLQVRRELEAAPAPPCASEARERMLQAMEAQIDTYLAFMADAGNPGLQTVYAARKQADAAWEKAGTALTEAMGAPARVPASAH